MYIYICRRVSFNNHLSRYSTVISGVPQGYVLGPLLFCIYMPPLGKIISGYGINYHCYVDDTQLYMPLQPNDPSQIKNLEVCVCHIKRWMCHNFLRLNAAKTDLAVIRPTYHKHWSKDLFLNLDGFTISSSSNMKNLRVIFDLTLTFKPHIREISKTAYFHLCNIAKIHPVLSFHNAVLHAVVFARLDYCNSLFSGLPNCTTRSLQLVQNSAARILTRTSRYTHITPILASLHWLPIQTRADFKVLLLTYKALNWLKWTDLLIPYISQHSLCSLNSRLLVIPSVNKKTTGCRAFSYRALFVESAPIRCEVTPPQFLNIVLKSFFFYSVPV